MLVLNEKVRTGMMLNTGIYAVLLKYQSFKRSTNDLSVSSCTLKSKAMYLMAFGKHTLSSSVFLGVCSVGTSSFTKGVLP